MNVIGIVAEYNPFHTGHAHQIAASRRLLGADCAVVAVMSGNWVQGGRPAALDKWTRARLALLGGADLVLELPTVWAVSSAETFARGATQLLAASQVVDALSFGSECGDVDRLCRVACCLNTPEHQERVCRLVRQQLPYAAARQQAVEELLGRELAGLLASPNNNLGVEYLRALRALGSAMTPMTVARRGAGHDSTGHMEGFASASHIRALLREGRREEAAALLPDGSLEALGQPASLLWAERAILARLRTMEEAHWAALPDGGGAEGLPARLVRAARQACSLEEFYTLAKTRRYTHARLRRLAVGAFLGLTQEDRRLAVPYVRVLGLNERGQALLKRMKGSCALPILTKPAQARALDGPAWRLFEAESRYTDLYGLCVPTPKPCGLEYTTSPVLSAAAGGGAPRR